jgi:thioredoxin-like negative regulator of GroEL
LKPDPATSKSPSGKDVPLAGTGMSKPDVKTKAGAGKDSSVAGTDTGKADSAKGRPIEKLPPTTRPGGLPSNPPGVSTPRGGPIVFTAPQIGTERWRRERCHHWRHDWDWAHRFWGPDYGTGNTFTFQNTYSPTIENSGNTTQQFDYSRPLASKGTKENVEQTDKGSDSKNNDDAQAAKDKAEADASKAFDQARVAFKDGDYDKALEQASVAIEKRPNDATLHEFKALCLFAQGKYKEAAPVLYAVIAAGPGWDSDTMNNLYGDEDAYQKQFKALRDYVAKEPDAAYGHFVLAYHYLAQGRKSSAVKELKEVNRTQPDDKLSAELLKVLAA